MQVSQPGQHQLQHAGRAGRSSQEAGTAQLTAQRQEAVRGRTDGEEGQAVPLQPQRGDGRGEDPDPVPAV